MQEVLWQGWDFYHLNVAESINGVLAFAKTGWRGAAFREQVFMSNIDRHQQFLSGNARRKHLDNQTTVSHYIR